MLRNPFLIAIGVLLFGAGGWAMLIGETMAVDQTESHSFDAQIAPILREIKQTDANVVFLNEDHNDPYTRLISSCFIRSLDRADFSVLAAETFSTPNPALLQEDPTLPLMGFYTTYPNFDLIIKAAKTLNWRLLPYETPKEYRHPELYLKNYGLRPQINNQREFTAAQNLLLYLENNPELKIFAHVGHAHVYKGHAEGSDGYKIDKAWVAELVSRDERARVVSIDQIPIRGLVDKMAACSVSRTVMDNKNMKITHWDDDDKSKSCSMYVDFTIRHSQPINSCD